LRWIIQINRCEGREAAAHAALQAALYRRDCPATMTWGDYQLGLLAEEERARIHDHLQRCPHCQAELSRMASFMGEEQPIVLKPRPNWLQVALGGGRAWLDEQTGRWRQIEMALSSLEGGAPGAPALAGLMGDETSEPILGSFTVIGSDANFEMKVRAVPESPDAGGDTCRLEVDVALRDRFGDFSGVQVTLLHDQAADTQFTNAQGEAVFSGVPTDRLAVMNLIVILPD
jgi:hypothetical protein